MNKYTLRATLFRHLDGITVIPTLVELHKSGILKLIQKSDEFHFTDISNQLEINNGYVNVALRILSSQGYLKRNIIQDGHNIHFTVTPLGKALWNIVPKLTPFVEFIPQLINISHIHFDAKDEDFSSQLSSLIEQYKSLSDNLITSNSTLANQLILNLQGMLAGPILVALGMMGKLESIDSTHHTLDLNQLDGNQNTIQAIFSFFEQLDWCSISDNVVQFNERGLFYVDRCTAYGVTVSYLPTFQRLHDLFVGDPFILWKRDNNKNETHVDRTMNVWGSGGAHSHYFNTIDEIVINIFNQPIEKQPKGIADMGCGDGTLLKHLYEVVSTQTIRGNMLDTHPLIVIGSDYNQEARIATRKTLDKFDINHFILHGNISDPNQYNKDLQDQYGIELKDMLNVRSFLDHNRIYESPQGCFNDRISYSSGAFAFRGKWISNAELKQNLVEHFCAWKPFVKQFGLLVLELHTISPELTSQNLGKTVATAYDATHGYSDQYIMEHSTFINSAEEAGLTPDYDHQQLFPPSELATISINLLK